MRPARVPSIDGRRPVWLLVVVLVGPTVWFAHLNISYALVYLTCRPGGAWWLHLVTVAAVSTIVVLVGSEWRRRRHEIPTITDVTSDPESGWHLVATLGWLLAAFFLLVTVMAGFASVVVSPCL